NLSVRDGERLVITRTGAALDALGPGDVLEGTLDEPPEGASSDLSHHLDTYEDRGGAIGAVAHAHPPGTVPNGWTEGEPHGVYVFGPTLEQALAGVEVLLRARSDGPVSERHTGVPMLGPLGWFFDRT